MSRSERALFVILRGYATSWMSWVVVFLVLVVHLVLFCDQRIYWNSIAPIEVSGGRWRSNNLPHDRERVDRLTVSNGEIRHRADGDVSRFDDWSRLPRLKHLVIEGEALALTEPQLIEVLNRLELTSLSIRKLGTMSEAGWAALERQPLKILQIRSMGSTDATVIRLPKTVEILDLPYSSIRIGGDVDRSPLEILRELPHLATITLQTRMSPIAGLRAADRDILQNIPTLVRIYVDPHIAESIQRELPRVAVRPTGYQANRVTKAIGLLMVGTLAFFLILHFLSLQFATTSSALVPRFHAYHFGVALFILTLLLLTQFLGFLGNGFHPWASMALAGAIVIPSYVMTELSARSVRFAGFINVPSMGFAIIFSIMMLNLAIMSDRAEADWMFQGQRNQLVALLIAVEALCVLGFYRFFARLARNLSEMAAGSVPLEVWSVAAWQRWVAQRQSSRTDSWFVRLSSYGPASRLQAALRCPRDSPRHASRLWRAGTAMSSFTFAGFTTVAVLLVPYVMSRLLQVPFPGFAGYATFQQTIFMFVMAPWLILMQWRPYLSRHLLMSLGRREWVQLVLRETAYDFLPAVGISGVSLGVYSYQAPSHWWPVVDVALFGFAALVVTYATLLIVATNPRISGGVFAAAILGFVAFVATMIGSLYIVISVFGESTLEAWLNCPPIWYAPLWIVAMATITIAYRRWMTWELGTIGR